MLEDIVKLHRAGRLGEAESGYREWLLATPGDAEATRLLGIVRLQRGDPAAAVHLLQQACALAPENAACWHTLGQCLLGQGQLDAAAQAYDHARSLNPNLAAAHVGLGQVALRRGDAAAAEGHFKVALRADPDHVPALNGLGRAAGLAGDAGRALKWLTAAAKLAPEDADVQTDYAHAMLDQNLLDFAAKALDNALAARPGYPPALGLRAEVHARKGELAAAQSLFEGLLASGEFAAVAHTGLGDVARAQARDDAALNHYAAALRLQPDLAPAVLRRAELLARNGQLAQAITELRTRLAGHPDGVAVHVLLAQLLARAGSFVEASGIWRDACARWPGDTDLAAQYALALDAAGQDAEAQAMAERAAASGRPGLALLRARGALLAGDPATAVARLQASANPATPLAPADVRRRQRLLGLAFDALEQWPEAVAAFLAAQQVAAQPLPSVPVLDEPTCALLQQRAQEPELTPPTEGAPVLLCGLPGSGLAQVAALLADQAGWRVRRDRFEASPDFLTAPFDPRLLQPLGQADLERLAARYRRAVVRAGVDAATRLADWIPLLDARVVPALKRALPGVRLVIVERRLEDTLLNWLGFGWVQGFAMPGAVAGARWLRAAQLHLGVAARLLPTLHVDPEAALGSQGGRIRDALAAFVGAPSLAPGSFTRAAGVGRGGLPMRFPSGRAARYREVLSEAFAVLDADTLASP